MIVLGRGELRGIRDFGHDWASPKAALRGALLGRFGLLALLRRGDEDGRAVLRAAVIALLILGRGVVHLEEPIVQELSVRHALRIEHDANRFSVPRAPGLDLLVVGLLQRAARVADGGFDHAGHLGQDVFHPPKAAPGKDGFFDRGFAAGLLAGRRDRASVVVIDDLGSGLGITE